MMLRMKKSFSARHIGVMLVTALFTACGGDQQTEAQESPISEPTAENAVRELANTTVSVKRGKASIRLGDNTFNLDVIVCVGTSMATAVASDRAKRAGYPIVTIKTYDPALSGGVMQNSILVFVDREDHQEQWKLQNGNIAKNGNVFTANGALEGFRMVVQEGGTTKRVKLEGISYMPFHTRIECK